MGSYNPVTKYHGHPSMQPLKMVNHKCASLGLFVHLYIYNWSYHSIYNDRRGPPCFQLHTSNTTHLSIFLFKGWGYVGMRKFLLDILSISAEEKKQ